MASISITSNEFIKLFNSPNQIIYLKDYAVSGEVNLTNNEVNCYAISLNNCIFEDIVKFEGVNFNFGIKFEDCEFKKYVSFSNTTSTQFNNIWTINFIGDAIIFNTCKVYNLFFINRNSFYGSIDICNQSEIGYLDIMNLTLTHKNAQFKIKGTTIKNKFNFLDSNVPNAIIFNKVIIEGEVFVQNFTSMDVFLTDSKFSKRVFFSKGIVNNRFYISDSEFLENFNSTTVQSKVLTLKNADFQKSCEFKYYDLDFNRGSNKISIDSSSFSNGIKFSGNTDILSPYKIEEIEINASNKLDGQIHFFNFIVINSNLTGTNYNAHLIFDIIRFQNLRIEYFTNYGNMQFLSMKSTREGETSLMILNSLLGTAHFSNCFLDSFSKISIIDSVLTDIVTSNVKWFSPDVLEKFDDKKNEYQRNREIFRQLKHAMEKQGNRIQALVFKEHEMTAFKKELFSEKGRFRDKTILCLNQSNNYGQDWSKPLLLLIPATIIFGFIFLIIFNLQFNDFCTTFCNYKKVFINILDPTHSLKNIFGEGHYISGYMIGFDILYKVIYAYLIFQFVSAFRKYIK